MLPWKANYSRFHRHRFRTFSILAPKKLGSCSRLFKVFAPALKIEDLKILFWENRQSWPALKYRKDCEVLKTHVSLLGKMQAVHSHILTLWTCVACPPFQIPYLVNPGSAVTSWIDDWGLQVLWDLFLRFFKSILWSKWYVLAHPGFQIEDWGIPERVARWSSIFNLQSMMC